MEAKEFFFVAPLNTLVSDKEYERLIPTPNKFSINSKQTLTANATLSAPHIHAKK
jgi:hypothetical protein